ncbi:MAG: hypothetical protein KF788_05810 [Piscinibacter sp.]|nr:hypothetical protein [Piscinibacter sp.]
MSACPEVDPRHLWTVEALSGPELHCLLRRAARLRETAGDAPLRGRNLALLCDDDGPDDGSAALQHAASALGAQVARLRAGDACARDGRIDRPTIRLLGRLYDAIDCNGLPAEQLEAIRQEAGVPVFNGLGRRDHPSRTLGELFGLLGGSGRPLESLRLAYLGDPSSDCARRWAHLADNGRMTLQFAASPDAVAGPLDLLIDARDGTPQLSPAVPAEQREANRRVALQAMLVATMA